MDFEGYCGIVRNFKGFLLSLMDCKRFHGVLGNFKEGFLRNLRDFR